MSLTLIGTPTKSRSASGALRTWKVRGFFSFSTTSLTGELPIDSDCQRLLSSPRISALQAPGVQVDYRSHLLGSISGTANWTIPVCRAGVVSAVQFTAKDGQAAHASIGWDWHIINKGAANGGTAVVVDRASADGANTNLTGVGGGSALTAYTPKALTITSVTADKTVAAGDILFLTITKNSTATTQTESSILISVTPTGGGGADEIPYVDEAALVNSTSGYLQPAFNTSITPNRFSVTVNRASGNPVSAAVYAFEYEGF